MSLDVSLDSAGNSLSSQQENYFKDSKVVDNNGNLLVMYHGTPYGGFHVFKNELNYFTANKEYANRYHNPSANSVRGRYDEATQKETYQVYLNIKKPFDTRNRETLDLFVREYVKGGYAMGINPYITEAEMKKQLSNGLPS